MHGTKARKPTPTFITELPLVASRAQDAATLSRFEAARRLHNAVLGDAGPQPPGQIHSIRTSHPRPPILPRDHVECPVSPVPLNGHQRQRRKQLTHLRNRIVRRHAWPRDLTDRYESKGPKDAPPRTSTWSLRAAPPLPAPPARPDLPLPPVFANFGYNNIR